MQPRTYPIQSAWELTGGTRFRSGWLGRPILEVELSRRVGRRGIFTDPEWTGSETMWRDADFTDLLAIEIDTSIKPKAPRP